MFFLYIGDTEMEKPQETTAVESRALRTRFPSLLGRRLKELENGMENEEWRLEVEAMGR